MHENAFAWFERSASGLEPLPLARSLWSERQLHGVAVSGLLARTLEQQLRALGRTGMVPARYHVDLFRPAMTATTSARAAVVRQGPRLLLLDATVEQEGEVVARGSATFLATGETAPGDVWSAVDRPTPPPSELLPRAGAHHVPLFRSDAAWSDNFGEHQNPGRHQTWQTAVPIVLGEDVTPFQAVASIADATSMVTNWGSGGVEYINTDIDLALARLPDGISLGLRAGGHVASDGIAVGTAEVYDVRGPIGTATVTALANTRRSVNLAAGLDGHGSA